MKQKIAILLALTILILSGCRNAGPAGEFRPEETSTTNTCQTDSVIENSGPVFTDPGLDPSDTEWKDILQCRYIGSVPCVCL